MDAVNLGQFEQIVGLLGEIRDRLPAPEDAPKRAAAQPLPGVAKSTALYAMLTVLDSWIDGAKSNHEASDHRGESRGEECWRQFAPEDIRRMVNDAAREVGVSEFPLPAKGREDQPWA